MRRIYLNVFCTLLILTTATVSSIRAEEYKPGKIMQDYQLQLATFSILNTDTPVELGIPTNNNPEPKTVQETAPVKMIPIATLNSQPSKPETKSETKPQADPPVTKHISKTKPADAKAAPKTEKSLNLVKPEKIVKQTPEETNTVAEKSVKEPETIAPKNETASDGWNSVSRKKLSILDTEPVQFDTPKPQPTKPEMQTVKTQPFSTLPEPQDMFEDEETENSVAVDETPAADSITVDNAPAGFHLGALESIPEPDMSMSPILEDVPDITGPEIVESELKAPEIPEPEITAPEIVEPEVKEPEVELAQTLKADTRMLELVDNGVGQETAVAEDNSIASANDDEDDLNLPKGADKFTFNPFAAAEKSKTETVNNVEVRALEFESLVPGETTIQKALTRWGEPNNKMENKSTSVYQYFRPIKNVASEVQVIFEDEKLTTILIQFEEPETIENLEAQYNLAGITPVVVRKKDGTAVGQAYPERGASLVYAQNADNPNLISRLILEPINTLPFVMRAESTLNDNPTASKADLEFVLNKEPRNAEAHWLYGRVLESFGEQDSAIEHLEKAAFLNNNEARFYVNLSLARSEAGLADLADKAADKVIELADNKDNPSPHLIAEAWRIKGDLESNKQNPNFKAALDLHSKAIVLAQEQLANPDSEIAQAALETLVAAHLGAARDIAWGNWNQKATAVTRWLNQANKYNELLISTAHYSERQIYQSRVRVASKALSAIAGVGKEINPVEWAELLTENGEKLLAMMDSPNEKEHLMWNIGMSLYDAVQVFQARKDDEMTLKYGQKAVECLEGASAYANKTAGKVSASDLYIQGRLYFRIGAIYAISLKDHQQAAKWYSKSLPIFETVADAIPRVEVGRLGETLISMGVSYWEIGKQTQAVNLTQNGIYCLEQAAEEGLASEKSLEIPYRNLSMMLNYMGKKQESSQYIKKAEALKTSVR